MGSVSNTANSQGNTVEQLLAARTSGPAANSAPVAQQMTPAQDQPANSSPNVASEPTTENNEPKEKRQRNLSDEEVEAAIAAGKGNFSSWGAWCNANNVVYAAAFFALDAEILMGSIHERTEETRALVGRKYGYYEYDPNGAEGWDRAKAYESHLMRPRNYDSKDVLHAFQLRFKVGYLRERIRDYNTRLDNQRWFSGFREVTERYNQVEAALQPPTQEPPRYDMERAGEYVDWAEDEISRLESLARIMLRQLDVDEQELTDFENRLLWLTPGNGDMLGYMEDARALEYNAPNHLLDGYFEFAQEQNRQRDKFAQLQIAIDEQTEQIRRNQEELSEMQQNLHRIMEENIAFFSQPYTPPAPTNNGNEDEIQEIVEIQNDNNLIHNNQIEEIQNDNNLIHNNQIDEIQEVTNEQDNNNLINNNQQQQPMLHIAPLNPPTPQQRNVFLGGTLSFIGNALSSFNPFGK